MPFQVVKSGEKWCVRKKMDDGSLGRSYGCHDSEESARNQQKALYAAEGRGELAVEELGDVVEGTGETHRFQAILTIEGTPTSDGRLFPSDSLTWRTLPIPLLWQKGEPDGGLFGNPHGNSVVVGRIDEIERRDSEIWGYGIFDTSDDAVEAERLVADQMMRWVSVDAVPGPSTDVKEDEESRVVTIDGAVIAGATIVAKPAFAQAVIALDTQTIPAEGDEMGRALAAGGIVTESIRLVGEDGPVEVVLTAAGSWDGSSSRFTDAEWKRATAGCEPGDAPPKTRCYLPHHDPGGALNVRGLAAAAGRFNQTNRQGKDAARRHLVAHYNAENLDVPPNLKAHAAPPASWFADPRFGDPATDARLVRQRSGRYACPLTIADDGRIFGHLFASRDQCHIGFPGECVSPPSSNYDYAYALRGATITAEGTTIRTGVITMGCGHAPHGISAAQTIAHYDGGPGAVQVADVVLGEDEYATWYAGALRPDLTDVEIAAFRAMGQVSGDWRHIGGSLELVAILAVPVPGFPINTLAASGVDCDECAPSPYQPSAHLEDGQIVSLVAAAPVAPPDPIAELTARIMGLESRLTDLLTWRDEQEREALRARIMASNGGTAAG